MIARTDFEGDSNVGAFGTATDRFVFVSSNMSEKSLSFIDKAFNLPLVQSTVATLDTVGFMTITVYIYNINKKVVFASDFLIIMYG